MRKKKKVSNASLVKRIIELEDSLMKMEWALADYEAFSAELFKDSINRLKSGMTLNDKWAIEKLSSIFAKRGMPKIHWS